MKPSLAWTSEYVAEGALIVFPPRPVDALAAAVSTKLASLGWTASASGTEVLAGIGGNGDVWLSFGPVAETRAIAAYLSDTGGPITLLSASCDGSAKPRTTLGRWIATAGKLVIDGLPAETTKGMRGAFSDRFNETYDAIADRVVNLLCAGALVGRSRDDLPELAPLLTMTPPHAETSSARIRTLWNRARTSLRFEHGTFSGKPALITEGFDGVKETAVLSDAEASELRALLASTSR